MRPAPRAGGADEATVRWRMRLAYDGSGFHGFAVNAGQRTVAGVLTEALSRVTRAPVVLSCAGRTDSGVHALDQVVHFDMPAAAAERLEPAAVVRSCNSQLGPAIVVREAGVAPAGFDARRSATSRRYRYLVLNAPFANPLLAGLAWHVADPLDVRSMAAAGDALLGEHDFRSFCRRVPGRSPDEPLVRRIIDARWTRLGGPASGSRPPGRRPEGGTGAGQEAPSSPFGPPPATFPGLVPMVGELLSFEIEANAFCHRMVRSLVGTLVDVGRGRKRASDMLWILRSLDRHRASQPAPPFGLTLTCVRYPE